MKTSFQQEKNYLQSETQAIRRVFLIYFFNCILTVLPVVFVSVTAIGCNNPFSTRTPEKPTGGVADIRPAKEPEDVIHNLTVSFEGLVINEYLNVFSEDFIFNPDESDSIKYELEFADRWDKQAENIFAYNFFDTTVVNLIEFPGDIPDYEYHPESDSYEYNYFIDITHRDNSYYYVQGRAYLYFRKNDEDMYEIIRWVDKKISPSIQSWGELRARYGYTR